jgi:general secretion pathway protein I
LRSNLADKRHPGGARSAGFTLIEVVVALAITALALSALMAAASTGLDNAAIAGRTIEATRRAQSLLAQSGVNIPLNPGELSGDDGGGFSWHVQISQPLTRAAAPESSNLPPLGIYTVQVTIIWRSGATTKNVSLQSQFLGRIVAPNG